MAAENATLKKDVASGDPPALACVQDCNGGLYADVSMVWIGDDFWFERLRESGVLFKLPPSHAELNQPRGISLSKRQRAASSRRPTTVASAAACGSRLSPQRRHRNWAGCGAKGGAAARNSQALRFAQVHHGDRRDSRLLPAGKTRLRGAPGRTAPVWNRSNGFSVLRSGRA